MVKPVFVCNVAKTRCQTSSASHEMSVTWYPNFFSSFPTASKNSIQEFSASMLSLAITLVVQFRHTVSLSSKQYSLIQLRVFTKSNAEKI